MPQPSPQSLREPSKLLISVGLDAGGQTAAAVAEYRQALLAGRAFQRRVLWLAPTEAAAGAVRDSLAAGLKGAILDPGITTFAGLAATVVREAGLRVRVV